MLTTLAQYIGDILLRPPITPSVEGGRGCYEARVWPDCEMA